LGFLRSEKSDIWRRWKAGETLHEIGRAFDKPHTSIRCLLLPRGGILPAARRRSRLALTLAEREDISRGIASGSSIREIASDLERATSTVSREVKRHGGRSVYRASQADDLAWHSALRPKQCLLALHGKLREMVASKLILDWSPEQISGWLKSEYPGGESMRVSHETIYRSLFIQAAPPRDAAKPTRAQLNLHNTRVRPNPQRLPSSRCIERAPEHRALHIILLSIRASDTALGLTGT
jgi:IS30 family transposase